MDQELESNFLKALEQNEQKLLRICSVYAGDADDRQDLFQEVLINIWQSMPTFEGKSSISTWMYRVTLNVCLRLKSKQEKIRAQFLRMDRVVIETVAGDEPNPEDHERLGQLQHCIRKLNDADRAVITLYLEELPYKEIAQITGLTENHIAVMVKRIKEKLLNCIKERSYGR